MEQREEQEAASPVLAVPVHAGLGFWQIVWVIPVSRSFCKDMSLQLMWMVEWAAVPLFLHALSLSSRQFRNSFCAAPFGRWRAEEFSFSLGQDSAFQGEVIFLVCTGLMKTFEIGQVCRCEAVYCFNFNFCATPSVLKRSKTMGNRADGMREGNQRTNRGGCWVSTCNLDVLLQNSPVLGPFKAILPCVSKSFDGRTQDKLWLDFTWWWMFRWRPESQS